MARTRTASRPGPVMVTPLTRTVLGRNRAPRWMLDLLHGSFMR